MTGFFWHDLIFISSVEDALVVAALRALFQLDCDLSSAVEEALV